MISTVLFLLLDLVRLGVRVYSFIWLIYCLLSWFPGGLESKFGQLVSSLVDPVLNAIQAQFPNLPPFATGLVMMIGLYILSMLI